MKKSTTTKRNTRTKTSATSGKAQAITTAQLQRFVRQLEMAGYKHTRLDKRLRTVSPAIVGLIEAFGYRFNQAPTLLTSKALVTIANDALGTHEDWKAERLRVTLLCDWAVRCALPVWIESRLPSWGNAGKGGPATAKELRELNCMLWPHQIIEALMAVHEISCSMRDGSESRDRGTQAERQGYNVAAAKLDAVLAILSATLSQWLTESYRFDDDHMAWMAFRAILLLEPTRDAGAESGALVAGLPMIVDALKAIRSGDSQRSVADRCTWTLAPPAGKAGKKRNRAA